VHATICRAAESAHTKLVTDGHADCISDANGITDADSRNRFALANEFVIYRDWRNKCAKRYSESNELYRYIYVVHRQLQRYCDNRKLRRHIHGDACGRGHVFIHDHRWRRQDRDAQHHGNDDNGRWILSCALLTRSQVSP
jgi:hypothetical protein